MVVLEGIVVEVVVLLVVVVVLVQEAVLAQAVQEAVLVMEEVQGHHRVVEMVAMEVIAIILQMFHCLH
jgi:hypothetical protein